MNDREVGLLPALWRYRWLVVAGVVVAATIGYAGSSVLPTRYSATANLYVANPRDRGVFGSAVRTPDPAGTGVARACKHVAAGVRRDHRGLPKPPVPAGYRPRVP